MNLYDMKGNSENFKGPFFKRLTDNQCGEIYSACLEVLENTGVYFEDDEAFQLLKEAGCYEIDQHRLSIPSHLIDWAVSKAPRQIILYDQRGNPSINIGGYNYYFGVGSDGNYILDYRTQERRKGKLSDIEEGIRLCDSLPNIDFVMSMLIPKDVPQEIMDRYQMEIMLDKTDKPIVFVNSDLEGMKDCVKMSQLVAGGEENLKRKPFIASYNNLSRPLLQNVETTQKIIYCAQKGIPCILKTATSMKGAITPVTTPAYLVSTYAGQLAGLLISQLTKKGAPFIFEGAGGGTFDMRTTLGAIAVPDNRGFAPDFSHFMKMPMFGQGGGSDAKIVDGQATAEAAFSILLQALGGAGIIHDVGYLESHNTQSFEMLVICNELISWVKHFMKGIDINRESMALDVIDEVEPDGNYMEHSHTLKHFREDWYPDLFDRNRYSDWAVKGEKSINQRARERVDELLANHQPEGLPGSLMDQLKEITKAAESNI